MPCSWGARHPALTVPTCQTPTATPNAPASRDRMPGRCAVRWEIRRRSTARLEDLRTGGGSAGSHFPANTGKCNGEYGWGRCCGCPRTRPFTRFLAVLRGSLEVCGWCRLPHWYERRPPPPLDSARACGVHGHPDQDLADWRTERARSRGLGLPLVALSPHNVRYRDEDVEAFIARRIVAPTDRAGD